MDDWVCVHKEICGELGKKGRKQKRFSSQERMRVAGEVTEKRSVKWGREFLNNFFGREEEGWWTSTWMVLVLGIESTL